MKYTTRPAMASSVLATALVLAGTVQADTILPERPDMEKCLGIAKAGMNDCGANEHSCGGHSTVDADPKEWIYLPIGTCKKIVGSLGTRSW